MKPLTVRIGKIFRAGAIGALVMFSGCAVRAGFYDTDHRDYHRWNRDERPHYDSWRSETHRPDVDYDKLKPEDRQAYWNWRHDHP